MPVFAPGSVVAVMAFIGALGAILIAAVENDPEGPAPFSKVSSAEAVAEDSAAEPVLTPATPAAPAATTTPPANLVSAPPSMDSTLGFVSW